MNKKSRKLSGAKLSEIKSIPIVRSSIVLSILLFLLTICTFLPTLKNDFINFDDQAYVVQNDYVNHGLTWDGIKWAFYGTTGGIWLPLTWFSHMFDCQIYGLKPWGHHLTSVLIHGLSTVLVFLWLRGMTGAIWRSFVAAVLFGLHPLRVESVAWVAERKDVLSTLFWLLTLLAYTYYVKKSPTNSVAAKKYYTLTLLSFLLGLLSKPMLVTLPFVLLLLDYWPLARLKPGKARNLILEKFPFFILAIVISAASYLVEKKEEAVQAMTGVSLMDRLGNGLISYVRYLGKFFWPENLCAFYPHPGHWNNSIILLAGIFLSGLSVFAWLIRKRAPFVLIGWSWYLITLLPVIGIVQLGFQAMADRYTYIPLIGISLPLVWGICELTKTLPARTPLFATMIILMITASALMTRYEIKFWKNSESLWNRALAVTKNNYVAHENLGLALMDTQPEAALAEFNEAVRLNPNFAEAQVDLANELRIQNRYDEAKAHYQTYLELHPVSSWAEYWLGFIYYKEGRYDLAAAHYEKALKYEPTGDVALNDLGCALLAEGKWDEAISRFQEYLKLEPDDLSARTNLDIAQELKNQAMAKINPLH